MLFGLLTDIAGASEIQVGSFNGKTKLQKYLKTFPLLPEFNKLTTLGITRDADNDASAAFQSVQGALREAGLPFPAAPGVFTGGPLRVGVLIIPPGRPGMLETLCLESVADDGAIVCVDQFFECVKTNAHRKPSNMSKARVHAWLSSQEEPDKRLGEAARQGYWKLDHAAFEPLRDFLRQM